MLRRECDFVDFVDVGGVGVVNGHIMNLYVLVKTVEVLKNKD